MRRLPKTYTVEAWSISQDAILEVFSSRDGLSFDAMLDRTGADILYVVNSVGRPVKKIRAWLADGLRVTQEFDV